MKKHLEKKNNIEATFEDPDYNGNNHGVLVEVDPNEKINKDPDEPIEFNTSNITAGDEFNTSNITVEDVRKGDVDENGKKKDNNKKNVDEKQGEVEREFNVDNGIGQTTVMKQPNSKIFIPHNNPNNNKPNNNTPNNNTPDNHEPNNNKEGISDNNKEDVSYNDKNEEGFSDTISLIETNKPSHDDNKNSDKEQQKSNENQKTIYFSGIFIGIVLFVIGNLIILKKRNENKEGCESEGSRKKLDHNKSYTDTDSFSSLESTEKYSNTTYLIEEENAMKNLAKIYEIKDFNDDGSFTSSINSYNSYRSETVDSLFEISNNGTSMVNNCY